MFGGFRELSANFTPTPNQFFDEVVGRYPARVVTVVAVLIRATLGWQDPVTGERRVEAELPLSSFVRTGLCENSARQGLREAVEAGLVVRTADPSNRDGARYALRWQDGAAQAEAIARARRATADPILEDPARGAKIGPPKIGPPESAPPLKRKKINGEKEKERTLNVRDQFDFVSQEESAGKADTAEPGKKTGNAPGTAWLERQAAALVEELADWGSERRHRQLLGVCEHHGLHNLPGEALRATRQRLAREGKRGAVEKPGAYYASVLVKLLEERQVFVPTSAEKDEDDAEEVRRLARQSFGLTD